MADRGWTRGQALAAVLCVAIVTLQLAIPIRAFFEPRPARFGWHMFSTLNYLPEAWIEEANGSLVRVDVMKILGDTRAEIHWSDPLAALLCGDSLAHAVIVIDRDGEERIPCT